MKRFLKEDHRLFAGEKVDNLAFILKKKKFFIM